MKKLFLLFITLVMLVSISCSGKSDDLCGKIYALYEIDEDDSYSEYVVEYIVFVDKKNFTVIYSKDGCRLDHRFVSNVSPNILMYENSAAPVRLTFSEDGYSIIYDWLSAHGEVFNSKKFYKEKFQTEAPNPDECLY